MAQSREEVVFLSVLVAVKAHCIPTTTVLVCDQSFHTSDRWGTSARLDRSDHHMDKIR